MLLSDNVEEATAAAESVSGYIEAIDESFSVENQYYADADQLDTMMDVIDDKSLELENNIISINEGIDGINTAVEESTQGVTMVADNASHLVEMLGNIRNDAESNRVIFDELSQEVSHKETKYETI